MQQSRLFAVLTLFFLVLFISWASFQYNDPDGVLWIPVYGLAAILTGLYFFNRLPSWIAVLCAVAGLVGSVFLASRVLGQQPLFAEEGREMFGLLIVTVWMGVIAYRERSPVE